LRVVRRFAVWALLSGLVTLWLYSDQLFPPEKIAAPTATIRDGDTLVLSGRTFRLYGIDAPEYRQTCKDGAGRDWPCGQAARLQLAALAAAGSIICEPQAVDRYGRDVARCASATAPDLARFMVEAGLAISPAERGSAVYADEEDAARSAKRGIWQGAFQMPAEYRLAHPRPMTP
jgi:endonuclease YncB( thermonuclease family)